MLRRNQESLLGPHNLSEISSLHKNRQCSLNDEVSGNTGPWVYLRKHEELKKHYPEILGIFHTSMPKENLISVYDKQETKPRSKGSSLLMFVLVSCLLLAAAGGGYYLYRHHQTQTLHSVLRHYRSQNYPRAMEILKANTMLVDKMLAALASSSSSLHWLPVLRTFAFWEDIEAKPAVMAAIREQSAVKTPADCSRASWHKLWRASMPKWDELLTHQKLLKSHWSLLLSWDALWLRERSVPNWHYPNSYEHGCFLSAYNAFISMSLPDTPLATTIRERIMWQARALTATADSYRAVQPTSANPLLVWNCMEQSSDLKTLDACRNVLKTSRRTPLVSYSYEKYRWNRLRIIAAQIKNGGSTNVNLPSLASSTDSYNAIDYSSTVDYLANISKRKK